MKYRALVIITMLFAAAIFLTMIYNYTSSRQYRLMSTLTEYGIVTPVPIKDSVNIVSLSDDSIILANAFHETEEYFRIDTLLAEIDSFAATSLRYGKTIRTITAHYNDAFPHDNHYFEYCKTAYSNNTLYYAVSTGIYMLNFTSKDTDMQFHRYDFDCAAINIEVSRDYIYISTIHGVTPEGIEIDIHGITLTSMQVAWVDRIHITTMQIPLLQPLYLAEERLYLVIDYENALNDIPIIEDDQYTFGTQDVFIGKERIYSADANIKDEPYYTNNIHVLSSEVMLKPAELKIIVPGSTADTFSIATNRLMSVLLKQYVSFGDFWFPLDPKYPHSNLSTACRLIPGLVLMDGNRVILLDIENSVWFADDNTYLHNVVGQEIVVEGEYAISVISKPIKVMGSRHYTPNMLFGNKWYDIGNGNLVHVSRPVFYIDPVPGILVKDDKECIKVSMFGVPNVWKK